MAIGYTPYSRKNQSFSDAAHQCAQTQVYPLHFHVEPARLSFLPLPVEQAMTLDADMGTDRFLEVKVDTFLAPIPYLIQERFRRYELFGHYSDITITEWNRNSNLPAELHKMKAGLFLYGKYHEAKCQMVEAAIFSVATVTTALIRGDLPFKRGVNRKNQSFISIEVSDLEKRNLLLFHRRWDEVVGNSGRMTFARLCALETERRQS